MNKLTAPFCWKRNTRGLDNLQKLIAIVYYPVFLLMWYGYYSWAKEGEQNA